MPPPLLLVHDDLATIASVRRALARAGHTVQLATSTADALSAFDQIAPAAVLLAPAVEGGQGARLLDELRARPAGALTPVVLLGEGVRGADFPVVALPVDGVALVHAVESALTFAEPDDVPLLDQGHMEELPPLVDAALAQAEADLEAEAFAGLRAPTALPAWDEVPAGVTAPPAPPEPAPSQGDREGRRAAAAEALARAAREEADRARARADAADKARAEAEEARARAETALGDHQRAEAIERARRTDAEARARTGAEEARRLEAEARAAHAQVDEARARAEAAQAAAMAAQAQGTAEAELLASALREEADRRTRELATQERLRAEAEARAEREANARAEAEARAAVEAARLAAESGERQEAARRARAEADDWAAREHEAMAQAERARAQAQALEVEAAQLAERLAKGERAALEALARAEESLRRERAAGEALRGELAAARASAAHPASAPASDEALPATAPGTAEAAPVPRADARVPVAAAASGAPWRAPAAAKRLEWGAADGGRVSLEQLAALVLRLEEVGATARLELRAGDTLRMLWLAEGALASAASTHPAESLVERAFSDGLLDEPTAAAARALRLPDEALAEELVEQGALREAEVLPLLQRCTEARALEALSERDTTYRLSAEAAPPTSGCASERPLGALLAEALKRALPLEEVEARTVSLLATPRPLRRMDLEGFAFGERERRLLEAVDGERTVSDLLRHTGIRQEAGLRALAVAGVLGLLDIAPPEQPPAPEATPEVELARLAAKWAASEEADYFTVLGLPRTAGTEEVQRAHARLAADFDPLRYAGHPDPEVPAQAARLVSLLDEAARALSDERLRTAYARSLVDAEGGSRVT
jgi:CheY-like chemotaxis protein